MIRLVALITQDLFVWIILAAAHTARTVLALVSNVILSTERERGTKKSERDIKKRERGMKKRERGTNKRERDRPCKAHKKIHKFINMFRKKYCTLENF